MKSLACSHERSGCKQPTTSNQQAWKSPAPQIGKGFRISPATSRALLTLYSVSLPLFHPSTLPPFHPSTLPLFHSSTPALEKNASTPQMQMGDIASFEEKRKVEAPAAVLLLLLSNIPHSCATLDPRKLGNFNRAAIAPQFVSAALNQHSDMPASVHWPSQSFPSNLNYSAGPFRH